MSKQDILIHACCATCAGYVLEKLSTDYNPVLFFYNPNIHPLEEYSRRRDELQRYAQSLNIPFIEEVDQPDEWFNAIKGFENEPEKGGRCHICFLLRLEKAASYPLAHGITLFTTTLSVSPHQDSKVLLAIGNRIAMNKKITFLADDFKKNNGFKRTMEIAKKENFYRQNYCGCIYSQR